MRTALYAFDFPSPLRSHNKASTPLLSTSLGLANKPRPVVGHYCTTDRVHPTLAAYPTLSAPVKLRVRY